MNRSFQINTSLPSNRLALLANIIPRLLIKSVHAPRYPRIIKPESIVFTSGTPLPHAYGANVLTSTAHIVAKIQPKETILLFNKIKKCCIYRKIHRECN